MALSAASGSFEDFSSRRDELIRQNFEPQLARIGLSIEQIERQSLEELNQSLAKVNDAISHPEGFGNPTNKDGGGWRPIHGHGPARSSNGN
jgi:hypothetical protein